MRRHQTGQALLSTVMGVALSVAIVGSVVKLIGLVFAQQDNYVLTQILTDAIATVRTAGAGQIYTRIDATTLRTSERFANATAISGSRLQVGPAILQVGTVVAPFGATYGNGRFFELRVSPITPAQCQEVVRFLAPSALAMHVGGTVLLDRNADVPVLITDNLATREDLFRTACATSALITGIYR
jgi:hypothetical protein